MTSLKKMVPLSKGTAVKCLGELWVSPDNNNETESCVVCIL